MHDGIQDIGSESISVYIVDGDPKVTHRLELLLGAHHLRVGVFRTAEEALCRIIESPPRCLVTEVYLSGMSGIELQRKLRDLGLRVPVIMLADHADVPLAVEAMQLGAVDFIQKPIMGRVLLNRVREAARLTSKDPGRR